ncbi:adult-specific rigid cuticular protein 15.7-like [Oppia nitens]|uniref:adult-specific rigid cuticular protein 15.7-like n=1 Tax=Oppia nitens TaxID=1686743 RepID=UPI0023DC6A63|nr:adult-specific rigid cuticular protein 15.7-like [Oppia nitens]
MFCDNIVTVLFVTVFVGYCMCSYGGGGGGSSTSKRQQDDHGNYMFNYEIKDAKGGQNYRSEKGDAHNNVQGSYGLHDVDGRMRVVDYWASKQGGFSAKIRSNEPGVGNADAAHATYNGVDQGHGQQSHMDINHSDMGSKYGGGGSGGYGGGKW